MAKKQRSKPRKIDKTNKKTSSNQVSKIEEEEDKSFDFGGIVNRDLKKNIGCGS